MRLAPFGESYLPNDTFPKFVKALGLGPRNEFVVRDDFENFEERGAAFAADLPTSVAYKRPIW